MADAARRAALAGLFRREHGGVKLNAARVADKLITFFHGRGEGPGDLPSSNEGMGIICTVA